MDFDQMLEIWRAQNTEGSYEVNRDALRRTLEAEEVRVRQALRLRRRGLLVVWMFGTGMAIWAGFWIAITIANGWPAIYAVASGMSLGLFALAAGASWVGRGREPERNFGNTLQEEVKRNLALVNYQLSIARRWLVTMLTTTSFMGGVALFSWTVGRSQDIPDTSGLGWFLYAMLFVALGVWASFKERDEVRKAKPKLELRQRRLRELLETLDAGE